MEQISKKLTPQPTHEEAKAVSDMETQVIAQMTKAINERKLLEAYILGWTSIEQFSLPRLINFIADKLKVDLPPDLPELPISQVTNIYYYLSHDRELYNALEKGRRVRNKIIHQFYKEKDLATINEKIKTGITSEIKEIFLLMEDRFTGKTSIPALTIYTTG